MDTKLKNFRDDLSDVRKFLADRKLLGDLAVRSGAKSRTVQYALSAKTLDELKGKRLRVYLEAVSMKKEIELIFAKYTNTEDEES
ncbi:MAG: hypothetical protein RL662_1734 [Bacteroidota bacterium]